MGRRCLIRKRAAVEAEDYDAAKALKADIERLRRSGEHAGQHRNGGSAALGGAHAQLNGDGQENPGLRNEVSAMRCRLHMQVPRYACWDMVEACLGLRLAP